jgi:hypothetical protein
MIKKLLKILVLALVFGMMVAGCHDVTTNNPTTTNNPFDGLSFYMYYEGMDYYSTLDFYSSTWAWNGHPMYDENNILTYYDFKGTYTYKGNVATMLSTHYRRFHESDEWVPWSGKWTATLTTLTDGYYINVHYNGAVNSIILLHEQIGELRGYRNIK